MDKKVNLSIVTTVYKSLDFLPEFIDNSLKTLAVLNETNFELVFVLDGITDNSLAYLLERKKQVPQIKIIELSRNFGHHYAISAGLNFSSGESVFLIDSDLEVLPESLLEFHKELYANPQLDVVYGFQSTRKGKFIERTLGGLFWKLFNFLSEVKVPPSILTERLMKRSYLNHLIQMGDKNLFMAGMMSWVGFYQKGIEIKKKLRPGLSSYSLLKRMNLLIEAITSFSEKPLKLIFYFGAIVSFISFTSAIGLTIRKLINPDAILLGFTSTMVLISLLFGVLILSIGLTGIYIARVFKQVQNRPLYIVRNLFE